MIYVFLFFTYNKVYGKNMDLFCQYSGGFFTQIGEETHTAQAKSMSRGHEGCVLPITRLFAMTVHTTFKLRQIKGCIPIHNFFSLSILIYKTELLFLLYSQGEIRESVPVKLVIGLFNRYTYLAAC